MFYLSKNRAVLRSTSMTLISSRVLIANKPASSIPLFLCVNCENQFDAFYSILPLTRTNSTSRTPVHQPHSILSPCTCSAGDRAKYSFTSCSASRSSISANPAASIALTLFTKSVTCTSAVPSPSPSNAFSNKYKYSVFFPLCPYPALITRATSCGARRSGSRKNCGFVGCPMYTIQVIGVA